MLSSQWGDKSKGILVDNHAADFDLRARYAESNNAGHPGTIVSTMTVLRTPPAYFPAVRSTSSDPYEQYLTVINLANFSYPLYFKSCPPGVQIHQVVDEPKEVAWWQEVR